MSRLDFDSVNSVARLWAETIWAVSWQFCLLGIAILLVHWSLSRAAPNWRYWLWQILAIKLLVMPFWTAVAPWSTPISNAEIAAVDTNPTRQSDAPTRAEESSPSGTGAEVDAQLAEPAHADTPVVPERATALQNKPLGSHQSGRIDTTQPTPAASQNNGSVAAKSPPRGTQINQRPLPGALSEGSQAEAEAEAENVLARESQTGEAPSTDSSEDVANESKTVEVVQSVPAALSPPTPRAGLSWQAGLMLLWLAGVSWHIFRIYWQGLALSKRLRQTEAAGPALVQRVADVANRLGLNRVPDVFLLDQDISPFVCGLWRADLVLPRGLSESFSAEQLDLVLLHELAHVRRRDLIWGWVSEIGRVLFFFHPLVHVMCYQIRFERELACDQLAMISAGRDAATYAETLVRVAGEFANADALRFAALDKSHV